MSTQEQERPDDYSQGQRKKRKSLSQRTYVILAVFFIAIVITTFWILSSLKVIPGPLATILSVIVTVFGAVFAFLQSLHLFFPADGHGPTIPHSSALPSPSIPASVATGPQTPLLIAQLPTTQPLSSQASPPDKTTHRGIVGLPPPTDTRTMQQREHLVKDIYAKLTQPNITAIALTGIGGIGKSTLAALVYRYSEEQLDAGNGPFTARPLWLRIDPSVTMADLTGNLFEAFDKPMPDLGSLSPQSQAVALFNVLNSIDKTRLVVLDQFENLLDWQTGHALPDRFGVGEWLDAINSQRCRCRVLLTSRPFPHGTHEYPPTYMQEYQVEGLEETEGIELLRKRDVKATEAELRTAVARCAGHALSLNLLASVLQKRNLTLTSLLKDPIYTQLWTGHIAHKLLDAIYMQQLDQVQRKLLVAFSVYREPVTSGAGQAIINETVEVTKVQVESTLDVLLAQHLIQASGEGRYQLHAIVASYARDHFVEEDEQANCKIRVGNKQGSGLKSGINDVSSTVSK